MIGKFFASLAGRITLAAFLVGVLIFGISQCNGERSAREESRLRQNQASAISQSARDAIAAEGALRSQETFSDQVARENADEIHNAAGAEAAVSPGVRAAGVDSLCKRAAYRGSEQCLRRSSAPGVEGAGAGSSAP